MVKVEGKEKHRKYVKTRKFNEIRGENLEKWGERKIFRNRGNE